MELKKCIYIILLISSFFSCKKTNENSFSNTPKENVNLSEYKQVQYIEKDITNNIKIFRFKDKDITIEYSQFTLLGFTANNNFNIYKSSYDLDSGELDLLRFDNVNQQLYLVALDDYAYKSYHAYSSENNIVYYLGELNVDLGSKIENLKNAEVSFKIHRRDHAIDIKQLINNQIYQSKTFTIAQPLPIFKSYNNIDGYIKGNDLKESKIPIPSDKNFFEVKTREDNITVHTKLNDKIFSNSELLKFNNICPQSDFEIIQKDRYFTIEKYNCDNTYYIKEFITFKYSSDLYLHKYTIEYTDKRNPDNNIPTKNLTVKNFGNVKFEDVTDRFLLNLRQDIK